MQAAGPEEGEGGGCTRGSEGRRSAEEGRPRPSVGFRSRSVLGEVGGRVQEGRRRLAGVAGRLAVLRRSKAVIHPYYAPVTLDAALSTKASASSPDTGGMVRITPDHACANPSQTVRRPDRPKAARGQKGKQVKVTRTKCKGSDFTVEML